MSHIKTVNGNWFYCRRSNGVLIRKVLGKVSEMTLTEAERMAEDFVNGKSTAPSGIAVQVKQARQQHPEKHRQGHSGTTLQILWDRYLNVYAKPHKKSWKQDEAIWDYHLSEKYGATEAATFDLAAVHSDIGIRRGKVAANHVANLVRRMFKVADLTPPKVTKFRERSRERFLSAAEIQQLLRAVEKSTIRDFVLTCLYTGARSGNVRHMRWEDVDLDGRVWTVPADRSKNGRSLRIHLTEKAVDVLKQRERVEGTQWVFPQRRRNGKGGRVLDAPMVKPNQQWKKLMREAGLTDANGKATATIHDLRRTLGSHLAMSGASMAVVAKVLGHADLKSTAIYARLSPSVAASAVDAVVETF